MAKAKQASGWVGWIYFAAVIMMLNGFLGLIAGMAGIMSGTQVLFTDSSAWLFDFTTWGWVQLILGVLTIWASVSLFLGHTYGRIFAIVASFLGALASLMYIPVYPFWGIIAMVLYIVVMYAVVVHGDELEVQ